MYNKTDFEHDHLAKSCAEHCELGRITWTEAKFIEALSLSRVDPTKASTDISNVVDTFSVAKITWGQVEPWLWAACQRVSKGAAA